MKPTALCLAICLVLSLAFPASAESYDGQTDYMALMIEAAARGDRQAGILAEQCRNSKIDALQLPYEKTSFDDLFLLSRLIYAEAGCEWLSDEWKMAVGEVVLNRVASPEFPDTLEAVLSQPGQYYGVGSRYFNSLLPSERCAGLACRLLQGERVLNDPSVVFQANVVQGSGIHTVLYDPYLGLTYLCYSSHPYLYADTGENRGNS